MTAFSFATADRILFGPGTVAEVAPAAACFGRCALLVTGRNPDRAGRLAEALKRHHVDWRAFTVAGEPEIEQAVQGARLAITQQCDVVIGFGGGSALDAAKAIAALATNTDPVERYLEVIGEGRPLANEPLPCIAVPTTAGTGSEVTRNAVLKSVRHNIKVSLRSRGMLPDLAVVDPELTLSLPPGTTAATGCDALTQLLESFVSVKANPLTDGLCREGLGRASVSLPRVVGHGQDLEARSDMALASLFSGLALANAGLGAVHGIAGPLGGMIPGPHGALCARLLPFVVEANVSAIANEPSLSGSLERHAEAARLLVSPQATVADMVDWLHRLAEQFAIPGLSDWGLKAEAIPGLVAKAKSASSMKGNPVRLSDEQLTAIIERAL